MGASLTLVILVIALALVGIIARLEKRKRFQEFSYRKRKGLLTAAERSFYGVLVTAMPENVVFAKVRVADLVQPKKGLSRTNWQKAFNKISAKHFDFVVCKPQDLKVEVVIELDDASHNAAARKQRDAFVEHVCSTADIPLVRIRAARSYNVIEIRKLLNDALPSVKKDTSD
ncbi:MAG: DUF2726 domain-containing protein [Pseudomonadota bacterium]